jgi:hypothetical protein
MWERKRDRYVAYTLCWILIALMTAKLIILIGMSYFGWK